mmetsp:Transcript_8255/g.15552  ORF Transcript_8255/g.15552 Transcript_8255/m.15552 type:complete len:562 (+) Transcript_8255:175-1860(+)
MFRKARNKLLFVYKNLTLQEISGSLGDLGTLIPLLVALSTQRSISLAPALFFAGLTNFITGLAWDVPMCVQPMKSISAVALSEEWEAGRVTAAGVWMGLLLIILGVSSLTEVINKIVPGNVVSGLQIGVGIRLAMKGVNMVANLGWIDSYDCVALGIACGIISMHCLRENIVGDDLKGTTNQSKEILDEVCQGSQQSRDGDHGSRPSWFNTASRCFFQKLRLEFCCLPCKRGQHPVGLYLFLIGICFASITLATTKNDNNEYDLPLKFFGAPVAVWAVGAVTKDDWKFGLLDGALPQLPLSTLNSVISVCALAHSFYPEKRNKDADVTSNDAVISRKEVAISVGVMNLLFCPFGSMPNCHGSGGLAGQHLLGARHGASMVFLGMAKMFVAVFLGMSALTIFDAFPKAVLGVMLAIAGQELATTGFLVLVGSLENEAVNRNDAEEAKVAKEKSRRFRQNTVIAVTTAIVIISTGKTHIGTFSGFVAHLIYGDGITDLKQWIRAKQSGTGVYNLVDFATPLEDKERVDENNNTINLHLNNGTQTDENSQGVASGQGLQLNFVI